MLNTVIVTLPQVSLALGASNVQALVHSTVLFVQAMLGAVVSTTVTVWLHVELFVQSSVACHVRVASNVFPQ